MPHPVKRSDNSRMPLALILLAIIAIIAIFAFGYHAMSQPKPFSQQVASMKASADSQLFVVGTLAPLGSFEYESSPLLTRLAVLDRHADSALQRGQISHDAAADVLAEGDSAYAVIAQATRVCDPAAHTGKCQGDRKGAKELLGEARRTVQGIPDYTPSR